MGVEKKEVDVNVVINCEGVIVVDDDDEGDDDEGGDDGRI